MGSTFQLVCNSCGAKLRVGSALIGRTVPCPKCNVPIEIQSSSTPSIAAAVATAEPLVIPSKAAAIPQNLLDRVREHVRRTWPIWTIIVGVLASFIAIAFFNPYPRSLVSISISLFSVVLILVGAATLLWRTIKPIEWSNKFNFATAKSFIQRTWPVWSVIAGLLTWLFLADDQSKAWTLLRYPALVAICAGLIASARPVFAWNWKRLGYAVLALIALVALAMDLYSTEGTVHYGFLREVLLILPFVIAAGVISFIATMIGCGVTGWISSKFSWRYTRWAALLFTLGVIYWWGCHDTFTESWTNGDTEYRDTYMRWSGSRVYRHLVCRQYSGEGDNQKLAAVWWESEGPVAGTGKPHGHWTTFDWMDKPFHTDEFYWYGDKISEGEWYLRNK